MTDTTHIVAIIQARMLSSRLPGKIMLPLEGRPLLQYQVERLRQSRHINELCVATVDSIDCDPIAKLCDEIGTHVVRGDENDVLSRFIKCADELKPDYIVRVTSDCPLIDPALVDKVIDEYFDGGWDFCAPDIPNSLPRGVDFEVFSADLLYQTDREATEKFQREHVAPFIYKQTDRFKCHWPKGGRGESYRFCVDTPEDYYLVVKLAAALRDDETYGWEDVVDVLDAHPDWVAINAQVTQKTV
jgi:spore coat polysaccharide biosynthesis protein SpsF